jgi:putative sterol carrier protein
MARFGRDIVRQLTDPSMAQGMFELGRQIGGLPGEKRKKQKEEKEREEALARFDEISRISGQAQSSAIAGTPAALAENIRLLEEARDKAPTLKEKQAIESRIIQLRSMTSSAQQKRLKGDISAVSQIDNVLEGIDERQDIPEDKKSELKKTLALRKSQLLENPEIEQGYRQNQVNEFQFERQEAAMLESRYMQENAPKFIRAVDSGSQSQIDSAMDSVPEEFKAAADKYITGAMRNSEIKKSFEDRSIELRTRPMTGGEITDLVDQLPEDVRKAVSPLVEEYKDAAKGWNDKAGEWNTKDLSRAKIVEKALRVRITDLNNRVLLRDLDEEKNQEIRNERDILKLELDLAAPLDRVAVKDEEMRLADQNKKDITPEITEQARANVRQRRNSDIINQIELLNESRAGEIRAEMSPYEKGEIVPDEEGNFYIFEGGDYTDEKNYKQITPKEAGVFDEQEKELKDVLELFKLKDEDRLPKNRMNDYIAAWFNYGNPDRAKRMLGSNEE